jgi:hypothetical protein
MQQMLMGKVGVSMKDNSIVCYDNETKDTTKKCYFEISLIFSELVSKIAIVEYLDIEAALNKSIEEGNDTESIIVLAKQLETLSAYKPGLSSSSSSTIPISRDELRQSVDTFIKAHGDLFSVKMLEDWQVKAEKL